MKKTEILAPAGGKEQLIAAVRCGADAVYLGTQNFNARSSATNFGKEDLIEAVKYCHARNVKVYITMNTLVTDKEIADVINEIKMIAQSGADAVIVQDLAVAELWKKHCPQMRLHASTQMTIHNLSGAKMAESLGFKRIVLARELTKQEIEHIAKNTSTETEVFIHGALCMSISGTCLMSSMLGARSGNRGRCAQPCRLNFKCESREFSLSLKDLSLIEKIAELQSIGVTSLKIEGRMKRPEYVAAAVTAAKTALGGGEPNMEQLKAVFSRSGFTQGYFEGKRNLDMFGYRRKEDVTAASTVLKDLTVLYKDEIKKIPLTISFKANEASSVCTYSDGENTVTVTGEIPQKAINKALDNEFAEKCFGKLGGTYFYADKFNFDIADGLSLSASSLNNMRREAIQKLCELREAIKPKKFIDPAEEKASSFFAVSRKSAIHLRFELFSRAFDDEHADKIILPMTQILKNPESVEIFGAKLVCELPFSVFATDEQKCRECLKKIKNWGVKTAVAHNIGTLKIAIDEGFKVLGGFGLNITNTLSFNNYLKLGCNAICASPEINMKAFAKIKTTAPKGLFAYGHLPLMRFRACPAQGKNGCADCKGLTKITDRMNIDFYILCSDKKYSSLLNSIPLYIGDKDKGGADFCELYFTFESQQKSKAVLDAFLSQQALPGKKTGGLYNRELE